ncbi:Trehalose-phosphatase [Trichophyton interdigitale]|uniref:Trehalose-phosphatase n=1 Tax=Trichophyton interdigitale TaxID=101480 RepID=A0A9P5CYS9_9EURO|nr:Trehalose-phosphatase [Trichophyton interdigitale]KAF3895230.1 Trehalose-phosphatase [Trichophyton interdigitale]KAG8208706.1 Trehalose-phosphatase [Trichophyton interdigitale]
MASNLPGGPPAGPSLMSPGVLDTSVNTPTQRTPSLVGDNPNGAQNDLSADARTNTDSRSTSISLPLREISASTKPDQHPDLGLSGRIISAAFCIPYKLQIHHDGEWELKNRPGTAALFDSFANLASPDSHWSHTLVGWTGEIEQQSPPDTPSYHLQNSRVASPTNKTWAPIPVNSSQKPQPPPIDGIRVTADDRRRLESQVSSSKFGNILPVWLSDELDSPDQEMQLKDQGRWRRYAEREIYTLFHYKQHGPTDGRSERQWWQDYQRLNSLFADRILETYKPGDIVWIHDYHLFLLPNLLRQKVPNIYIGFFLHVPFPSSEFLRCLSKRKDILTGALGANMIGFQSHTYARHFTSCCTRILAFSSTKGGIDAYGAHVAVDVFPIGIDVQTVRKLAYGDPNIENTIFNIKTIYSDKKIIVGRDRLDSVRGVTQKLMAFEMFLERYPQWRGKVVLIQVTSPTSMEEQKEEPDNKLSTQISQLVSTINGRFGSISFSPVQYYPQYLPRHEYFALLRAADVGLITSVRDGMNTTSLEYVVCQHKNQGPLILSEFSGTAGILEDAIHINPWDLTGVANAINTALTMTPETKAKKQSALYEHVTTHTVVEWYDEYLKRLLANLSSFNKSIITPALDKHKLISQYRSARRRLFMFDYDGTLTPIVKDPQAAIPSDRVLRTLKSLAADPKNAVWIISGRDQNFLEEWMGHITELGLSAEHGCFIRKPRSEEWTNLAAKANMSWQNDVLEIFQYFTERTPGAFIERKRVALTWHYRPVDPEYGAHQAKECRAELERTVATKWPVDIMEGKANLEVRPAFVNKGEIAKRLIDEYAGVHGHEPEFVLCLGDDFTDEDMFRALKSSDLPPDHVFSVTVGASSKQTQASWHLREPADVISTVTLLNNSKSAVLE